MSKVVESFDGNNLPITKETIEALSNAIEVLGVVVGNTGSSHVLVGGMGKDGILEYTKEGVISANGELIPFLAGARKSKYNIINEPIIIEGIDADGALYKTVISNKYAQYADAGVYNVNDLIDYRLVRPGSSTKTDIFSNALGAYLSDNFVQVNIASARLVLDLFKRVTIYARLKFDRSHVGNSNDILIMTLPSEYRPKLTGGVDRLYFNAYIRPYGEDSTKLYPMYIIPATGEVYIDIMGEPFSITGYSELYFQLSYIV